MRQSVEEMTPVELGSFAREIIMRRLAERAHSRHDLAQALAKRHVPEEVVDATLDKFAAAGLINDEEFARSWAQGRQRGKGLARRAIAMELRRKGIDEEIAREVLADIDLDDEREAAHRLVQTKLRSMAGLEQQTQTRRLVGMLARKGYPPGLSFDVVRAELNAEVEPLDSL